MACLLVLPDACKHSRPSLLMTALTAFQLINKTHALCLSAEVLQEQLAEACRYAKD